MNTTEVKGNLGFPNLRFRLKDFATFLSDRLSGSCSVNTPILTEKKKGELYNQTLSHLTKTV
jgi:hypothetical protein